MGHRGVESLIRLPKPGPRAIEFQCRAGGNPLNLTRDGSEASMNSTNLQAYREMIADPVRMAAYADALRAVAPGRSVCEIGVGLGPLCYMCNTYQHSHCVGYPKNPCGTPIRGLAASARVAGAEAT